MTGKDPSVEGSWFRKSVCPGGVEVAKFLVPWQYLQDRGVEVTVLTPATTSVQGVADGTTVEINGVKMETIRSV